MSDVTMKSFVNAIINNLNNVNCDYQKPWIAKQYLAMPRNINGRYYNNINKLMLLLTSQCYNYPMPVWGTKNSYAKLAKELKKDIHVLPNAKGTPISYFSFSYVNKENGKKINYAKYDSLSSVEQKNCSRYSFWRAYWIYNIDETNLKDVAPEYYSRLINDDENKNNTCNIDRIDSLIHNNSWICPINIRYQDKAYYNIVNNFISVPMKQQFKIQENFYSTLLHEMAHSTMKQTKRELVNTEFGSPEYGREELVAELTSLMVCSTFGIEKYTKDGSQQYIKGWIQAINENNDFLMTVLDDVQKAYKLIINVLDKKEKIVEAA